MPGILSNSAYTCGIVIGLMVASWYGWLVEYGLLDVDFFGYVFGVCEDVALSILDVV
jgi:hypothetical protein